MEASPIPDFEDLRVQRRPWRLPRVGIICVIVVATLVSSRPAQAASLSTVPTITSVQAGDHRVTMFWTEVAPRGAVAPTYVASTNPENVGCTTVKLTCTLSPLRNGQLYGISVRAIWGTAKGDLSRAVSVIPASVPGAPNYVVATAGDHGATIRWQEPHGDGGLPITSYRATVTPGGASCTTLVATTCTVVGLNQGQLVSVQVRARNAMGEGAPSLPSPVVQAGLARVTGVTAEVARSSSGLGAATIHWNKIPRANVTYVAMSSDGKSSCHVLDETSCTAMVNGLQSVSFSVTGHTTTPFGLPLSTITSLPSATLPVRVVVVVAGQSNATGVAAPGSNFPAISLSTEADEQARLTWDPFDYLPVPRSGWLPLSTPQQAKGSSAPSFGPEVGLARTAFLEGHVNLSVVKVTYGGTSLARGWTPARPSGLFAEMVRFTKRQLTLDQGAGVIDVLRGFVWFQGENDALSLVDAANYKENLTALLSATRSALPWAEGARTVLIVQSSAASIAKRASFGLCSDPTCSQELQADALVRAADQKVAATSLGVSLVDSFGYARANDAVHLTAESELAIGRAVAHALGSALGLR